jgi:hypothetical protein
MYAEYYHYKKRKFRHQFTSIWKVSEQQTVREHAEEKCIMNPQLKKTVVHKLHARFCNAKLNFVNLYLLGVEKDTTLIKLSCEN